MPLPELTGNIIAIIGGGLFAVAAAPGGALLYRLIQEGRSTRTTEPDDQLVIPPTREGPDIKILIFDSVDSGPQALASRRKHSLLPPPLEVPLLAE